MNDEFNTKCFLTIGVYLCAIVGVLIWWRKDRRLSRPGIFPLNLAIPVIAIAFLAPGIFWVLGLLLQPYGLVYNAVRGIGGDVYGDDPHYYLGVAKYFIVNAFIFLAACSIFFRIGTIRGVAVTRKMSFGWPKTSLNQWVHLVILLLTIAYLLAFFTAFGWDRFWFSPYGRFQSSPSAIGFGSIKFVLPLGLLLGAAGVALFAVDRKWGMGLLVALLSSLAFLASSSRGFSVIAAGVLLASLRFVKPSWRIATGVLIGVPLIVVVLMVPIEGRRLGGTGIAVGVEAFAKTLRADRGSELLEEMGVVFTNLGQGFGVFSEYYARRETGLEILDGVDPRYTILSFLPTVSALDGFSKLYRSNNPRINKFTPFNTFSEVSSVNALLGYVFVPLLCAFLMRLTGSAMKGRLAIGLLFVCFTLFMMTQAQQYQTRTFMRFFYISIFLLICIRLFDLLTAKNFRSPNRKRGTLSPTGSHLRRESEV